MKFPRANYPDKKTLQKIINELRSIDLSSVSYEKIVYYLLRHGIPPFTTAILKKGNHIERARINLKDEIFTTEKEISYRTDYTNIKKYGRANQPEQSLFYGAIKSENIQFPRIINLLETSEIFKNGDIETSSEFTLTVGKWRITQDFEIIESVFNKQCINSNPQTMAKYQYHYNNIKADFPDQIDEIEFLLEFFSDEFAKKDIKDDSDYKISAAYTNIAINNRNYAGVLYPSVRSEYQGYNIALTIPAVENCLDLELAAMVKIHKNKNETLMENIALATDLGNLKSDFKWVSIKGTDEDYINKKIFDY